jgi:hypothetical protein
MRYALNPRYMPNFGAPHWSFDATASFAVLFTSPCYSGAGDIKRVLGSHEQTLSSDAIVFYLHTTLLHTLVPVYGPRDYASAFVKTDMYAGPLSNTNMAPQSSIG